MPGHPIDMVNFKDNDAFNRYRCPECNLLLKEAVQLSCGHRLCRSCAEARTAEYSPQLCPVADCKEPIDAEDGLYYFPDRFVWREINSLEVTCPFAKAGCNWEGKVEEYVNHTSKCDLRPSQSLDLSEPLPFGVVQPCSESLQCPLSPFGCSERFMDLRQHLQENQRTHLMMLVDRIQLLEEKIREQGLAYLVHHSSNVTVNEQPGDHEIQSALRSRDEAIAALRSRIRSLESLIQSKRAEIEDRDFRLWLVENSNHDGTMIWKIPRFSQRKADAENGKCISLFSPSFYTGRYGYRMCLHLYIMGDGTGKGTHLSLFFVVMRGEFDNILQWPFTHKVTIKLINQAGGTDIVDTFQPDPMSSSFRKPKSDMNIASGCPRFVSHVQLEEDGFIVDDTIFIKCIVDTSTICHP